MAYQTIQPQPVVQSQDGPTRSGNACLSCWCWTLQALVWILLIVGIILLVNGSLECFYGWIGCYIVYIISELCSPTFGYLRHQKGNDRMYEKMGELFRTAPVITFHCVCYHYETRHTTYKDSNGHTQHRTERVLLIHIQIPWNYHTTQREMSVVFSYLISLKRTQVKKRSLSSIYRKKLTLLTRSVILII